MITTTVFMIGVCGYFIIAYIYMYVSIRIQFIYMFIVLCTFVFCSLLKFNRQIKFDNHAYFFPHFVTRILECCTKQRHWDKITTIMSKVWLKWKMPCYHFHVANATFTRVNIYSLSNLLILHFLICQNFIHAFLKLNEFQNRAKKWRRNFVFFISFCFFSTFRVYFGCCCAAIAACCCWAFSSAVNKKKHHKNQRQ